MSGNLEKDISDYYNINEMIDEEGKYKNIIGVGSFTHHNLEEALYVSKILAKLDVLSQIESQIIKNPSEGDKNLNFIIDNFLMDCSLDSPEDKSNFKKCEVQIIEYNSSNNLNNFLIIDYENNDSYFLIFSDLKNPSKVELSRFIDFGYDLKLSYTLFRDDNGERLIYNTNNIDTSIYEIMTWFRKDEDQFEVQKTSYFNFSK